MSLALRWHAYIANCVCCTQLLYSVKTQIVIYLIFLTMRFYIIGHFILTSTFLGVGSLLRMGFLSWHLVYILTPCDSIMLACINSSWFLVMLMSRNINVCPFFDINLTLISRLSWLLCMDYSYLLRTDLDIISSYVCSYLPFIRCSWSPIDCSYSFHSRIKFCSIALYFLWGFLTLIRNWFSRWSTVTKGWCV